MPNGGPVFDGFPRLVPLASIDYRVANWFSLDGAPPEQVVEMAPGVYAPYNELIPDLTAYLDGSAIGDCMMIDEFFPYSGSTCWEGVG